jgi:hypothetical protein
MTRPSTVEHMVKSKPTTRPGKSLASLLFFCLSLLLAACADPGSGGSGLPSGASSPPPQVNTGSGNLSALRVEILEANAVTIGGVRYLDSQIDIVLSDGAATNFAALKVGQGVAVTQTQSLPLVPRWKVVIQAP